MIVQLEYMDRLLQFIKNISYEATPSKLSVSGPARRLGFYFKITSTLVIV